MDLNHVTFNAPGQKQQVVLSYPNSIEIAERYRHAVVSRVAGT